MLLLTLFFVPFFSDVTHPNRQIENQNIGWIQILQQHKKTEVDRTIQQCWEWDFINTNHTLQNCLGVKVCLKCDDLRHPFFNCPIPKKATDMIEDKKTVRLCVSCTRQVDHTTLDCFFAPIKSNSIIKNKISQRKKKQGTTNTS